MRLLILSNLYHPDRAGGAAIYTDFARAMAERGHDVTVRSAYPYFPEWIDKSGQNGWRIWRYEEEGVHVERYGQLVPVGGIRRLGQRLLFEASQTLSQLRSMPRGKFDAVVTFATHPGTTAAAVLIATARRRPLVISIQDLAGDAAGATGLAGGRAATALRWTESRLLRRASLLYAISPGMAERVTDLVPSGRVEYLPNWLNASLATETSRVADLVADRRFRTHPRLRFLYAGNIGAKQDLLRLVQRLADSELDFELRIHAAGRGAEEIQEWLTTSREDRVSLHPFLSEHDFVDALLDADLFVLSETPGSGHSYMPSKLIPALATGTPVLAVSDAESSIGRELRASAYGIHREWSELDALLEELPKLDAAGLKAMSRAARSRSEAWDREMLLDRFEGDLLEIVRVSSIAG